MNPIGPSNMSADLSSVTSANVERYRQADFGKNLNDEQIERVAKDFESVLLHKLMEAMQKTVPESGLLETGITKQFQDMFWFHMAQEMADQGGLGIWKMIYQQIKQSTGAAKGVSTMETEQ